MEDQGIMALPMAGMQAPTAAPASGMNAAAAIDATRSMLTPSEISKDTIDAIGEEDPRLVEEFSRALSGMDLPEEVIDALGKMVDAILAEPEKYQEIRAEFIAEGVPQELLPLDFDPAYFAAMNIALDQLASVKAAAQPQGFAAGGSVMSPIAAGLASMGRNGDRMLAHITPSEARLLRMRGGSGTINPYTGLPEFFLKSVVKAVGKVFKGVGNAVKGVVKGVGDVIKKIASSPLGRIALTVAAVYFMGPAGLNFAGTAGSITGLTGAVAVGANTALASTVIGLASGQKFKDALKTGAVSGLLAGAGSYISNIDPYATQAATTGAPAGAAATPTSSLPSLTETATSNLRPDVFTTADVSAFPSIGPDGAIQYGTPSPSFGQPLADVASRATGTVTDATQGALFRPETLTTTPTEALGSGLRIPGGPGAAGDLGYYQVGRTAATVPGIGEGIVSAARNIGAQQYGQAVSDLGNVFFGTTPRTIGTGLAALTLAGGFTPKQPGPPGIIPTETGTDLLARNPELYGVKVGGANVIYGYPYQMAQAPRTYAEGGEVESDDDDERGIGSLMYVQGFAVGGKVSKAPVQVATLRAQATKREGQAQNLATRNPKKSGELLSEAATLRARADALEASYQTLSKGPLQTVDQYRASIAPKGQMLNPEYEQRLQTLQRLPTAKGANLSVYRDLFPRQAGESGQDYKTRFYTEVANLYRNMPEMYILDPNYQEPTTITNVTPGSTVVASPGIVPSTPITVGGTTVPSISVGGGQSGVGGFVPSNLGGISNLPNPVVTSPSFGQIFQPGQGQTFAPSWGGTGPMPNVPYAPNVFTSQNRYPYANPTYQTYAGLAYEDNPFLNPAYAPTVYAPQPTSSQPTPGFAKGGIANLPSGKQEYFPRRNGHINGPGTGTSDDVPAMLSDGEFVFTAKAVRAAGNGSRRLGAKRMYAMMKALEGKKNG